MVTGGPVTSLCTAWEERIGEGLGRAEHGEVSGRPIRTLQHLHGDEEQFHGLGREDRLIMVDVRGIVFPRQQERA